MKASKSVRSKTLRTPRLHAVAGLGIALWSACTPADEPIVPLCTGLQIVTAVSQANGDYESIKTIESVDAALVRIRYSAEQLVTDLFADDFGRMRSTRVARTVRRADLRTAASYQQRWFPGMAELIPETTAIGTSAAVLAALRGAGFAELSVSTAYDAAPSVDRNQSPNVYDFQTTARLERTSAPGVRARVLVNGVPTDLPVVVARGDFAGEEAEFRFLDDPANPLALAFRIGIDAVPPASPEQREQCDEMIRAAPEMRLAAQALCGRTAKGDSESLQVVKITYRCPQSPPPARAGGAGTPAGASAGSALAPGALELETALTKAGRMDVYDIHFSFNSDRIRDESLPRLAEVAAVLKKHPEWRLAVGGHTDAIGNDAANLDLSTRRAAAVRAALTTRFGIAAARLTTAGYGEAQPRDTNETLQGRARNRRVELVRQEVQP